MLRVSCFTTRSAEESFGCERPPHYCVSGLVQGPTGNVLPKTKEPLSPRDTTVRLTTSRR